MANTFIGIARGNDGFQISDFTVGAASTATLDVELRIATLDQQGNVLTSDDCIKMVKALKRALEDRLILTAPPL